MGVKDEAMLQLLPCAHAILLLLDAASAAVTCNWGVTVIVDAEEESMVLATADMTFWSFFPLILAASIMAVGLATLRNSFLFFTATSLRLFSIVGTIVTDDDDDDLCVVRDSRWF